VSEVRRIGEPPCGAEMRKAGEAGGKGRGKVAGGRYGEWAVG